MDKNEKVRNAIAEAGLHYWKVAAEIGIHRVTLCEWLRLPLSEERYQKICKAIDRLVERGAH